MLSVSSTNPVLRQGWVLFLRVVCEPSDRCTAGPAAKKVPTKSKGKAAADSKKKTSAAAKKPPAKKASAKKSPVKKSTAKQIQSDEEMSDADIEVSVEEEDEQQATQDEQPGTSQSAKGKKGSKRAAANRPGPGSIKAGAIAGTSCCLSCYSANSILVQSHACQSNSGAQTISKQCLLLIAQDLQPIALHEIDLTSQTFTRVASECVFLLSAEWHGAQLHPFMLCLEEPMVKTACQPFRSWPTGQHHMTM